MNITDAQKQRAEEILKKHREYGDANAAPSWCPIDGRHSHSAEIKLFTCRPCFVEDIALALAEAVAAERERCAKVGFDVLDSFGFDDIGKEVAAKIRETP